MTAVTQIFNLIQDSWQTSRPGRTNDLPDLVENGGRVHLFGPDRDVPKERLRGIDAVHVMDGGTQNWEPAGLNYSEETVTSRVDIVISTGHSNERFYGHLESASFAQADPDSGLLGEVKAIITENRKGGAGWDLIIPRDWNDNSENYGKNYWKGVVNIELQSIAKQI